MLETAIKDKGKDEANKGKTVGQKMVRNAFCKSNL